MTLTGKQRRHLRALGHHLDPVVQLGKHGVTEAVVQAVDVALLTHELIKIRRGKECPSSRSEVAAALAAALGAEVVQQLGHTLLFYRPNPEEPVIELPR
jgi:RNA-binding protein